MEAVYFKSADSSGELHQILELQRANLRNNLPINVQQAEGFVTVEHDFNLLEAMNNSCPHTIAVSNSKVVGYALSMTTDFKDQIEVLKPMFSQIELVVPKTLNYIVMGQVCVSKEYRKKGVFRGLYNKMKKVLGDTYTAVITEVDQKNTRSLVAHQAVGFEKLKTYISNNQDWELIIWYFNPQNKT
ncbi:GNAT family N-acetyltransferase [Gaetbulibacter sp. M240]|uniref:GNAT family N-acetyltransferase n=1 Tax=Gaetbulibacter sp. M240 TaxID=3126511 RepID=UPI00374F61F0